MDPQGVPVQSAEPARQPAAGTRDPAGTHAAGTGGGSDRVRVVAGQRRPLGTRHWLAGRPARCGSCFGQGGREAEAQLELALAEFRALGERFGISLALSELAGQLAMRGEFAGACELLRTGDRGRSPRSAPSRMSSRLRTQQALLYWLQRRSAMPARPPSPRPSGAPKVSPGRTRWSTWRSPRRSSLAWGGDTEEARRQLGLATTLLGDAAEQPVLRAEIHNLLGYLADDLRESRTHRVAAWQAASEAGAPS